MHIPQLGTPNMKSRPKGRTQWKKQSLDHANLISKQMDLMDSSFSAQMSRVRCLGAVTLLRTPNRRWPFFGRFGLARAV